MTTDLEKVSTELLIFGMNRKDVEDHLEAAKLILEKAVQISMATNMSPYIAARHLIQIIKDLKL